MKVTGIFEIKRGGFGFVRCEDGDIFIPSSMKNGAMHGQTVEAEVASDESGNDSGWITRVLSPYPEIVGNIFNAGKKYYVVADNPLFGNVFVKSANVRGAVSGDKVVVNIVRSAVTTDCPEGTVKEILGKKNDPLLDSISVARSYGFKASFPKETEKYARGLRFLPDTVIREDFRTKTVFTIDGDDAKDLDDAVSVEKLRNGNYQLGVHIADVSHYVREGDPVDTEALRRGTSVYFPDMVIPMLPAVLSNDLCSLNPDEDKLTLSCIMEIDSSGKVCSSELKKSIIRSKARLTYSGVNSFFDGDDKKGYAFLGKYLNMLLELSHILRQKREKKGSIDFNIEEAEIKLDEKGCPLSVDVALRGEAEKLIEDCMLAANMTVAETYNLMNIPFIYRIHEQPDGGDIHKLSVFLSGLGFSLKGSQNIHPKAIQTVLKEAEGTREEAVINRVTLRFLKKAKYDALSKGHFGLSAENYCHFTSPIRRYPDLMVHRIISAVIDGQIDDRVLGHLDEILPHIAYETSESERKAVEAERLVRDKKMAQYMERHKGEVFEGIVSGVSNSSVFVELENTIEGRIPLSELSDDYYELDKEHYQLIGEATGKKIRIGDHISVMCASARKEDAVIVFVPM